MDCKQAELSIMRYAEKSISPSDANELTKHLLFCEQCRESFVAFDICLDETPIIEAPADFTQNVMARVKEANSARYVWVRAFVGLAAVVVGALLFVALNFGYQGDFFATLSELVQYYSGGIILFLESISFNFSGSERFGLYTFLFVPVLSVLLFVLHSTEKKVEA